MNIDVTKDEVKILENSDLPNENEYKITKCYFAFDEYTNSFQVKRAIFTVLSSGEMYETDIINNECDIPVEVLEKEYERVKIGVYGYNIGENEELLNRFSPSYDEFIVPTGSYEEGALSPEPITPSQYDLYSQALQKGLSEVDDKLDEIVETVDDKLREVDETMSDVTTDVSNKLQEVDLKIGEVDDKLVVVDGKLDDIDIAITEANTLNIDVDKVGKVATIDLTRKNGTHKYTDIRDGYDLDYNWDGTQLGIKREDESEYEYADLKGEKGDCYFATFEIEDGKLLMNKPDDMTQIDFRIDNGGHLLVEVTV